MDAPVPEAVTYPEDFTEGWRVLPDPHEPSFVWRCRALTFEFRATPEYHAHCAGAWPNAAWRWYARDESRASVLYLSTPQREAVWRRLFLNP